MQLVIHRNAAKKRNKAQKAAVLRGVRLQKASSKEFA